jgi:hypothetical protein
VRIATAADVRERLMKNLPAGIYLKPGELRIEFFGAEDLLRHLFELSQAMVNDYERFRASMQHAIEHACIARGERYGYSEVCPFPLPIDPLFAAALGALAMPVSALFLRYRKPWFARIQRKALRTPNEAGFFHHLQRALPTCLVFPREV